MLVARPKLTQLCIVIMKLINKIYLYVLLVWATIMLLWGTLGGLEYLTGLTLIAPFQNSAYPSTVQLVHWVLITLTGGSYLLGFFTKWKYTPILMALLFSNLAVLCTIETFDFMSEQWSVSYYITEMSFYALTASFLILNSTSKQHFTKTVNQ